MNTLQRFCFPPLLLIVAVVTEAAPVCSSLEQCIQLRNQVDRRVQELKSNPDVRLSDLARKADGSPKLMGYAESKNHCESQGQRLPTARELALYARRFGAIGPSHTPSGAQQTRMLPTWNKLYNQIDFFYYSNSGFQNPISGPEGNLMIWSDDRYVLDHPEGHAFDRNGDFRTTFETVAIGARCVIAPESLSNSGICSSLTDCAALRQSVDTRVLSLQTSPSPAPVFTPIVTTPAGLPELMDFARASEFCLSRGFHLPSARELAQFAATHGAPLARERSQMSDDIYEVLRTGYKINRITNVENEVIDVFFTSLAGYIAPSPLRRTDEIWSTSKSYRQVGEFYNPRTPVHLTMGVYAFEERQPSAVAAVMCVTNRQN